jgi:hypothetical protein
VLRRLLFPFADITKQINVLAFEITLDVFHVKSNLQNLIGYGGGLLYLGGLRFCGFLAAVFRFFTKICAVFRFCRLLRFAEIDAFLTRFSDLSYIYSGFSVFEKYAVCGNFPPYCSSRFADIRFLIAARGLPVFPSLSRLALCASEMQQTINDSRARYLSTRSIDISFYTFDRYLSISANFCYCFYRSLIQNRLRLTWTVKVVRVWYNTF